jgi:hypothetical protein
MKDRPNPPSTPLLAEILICSVTLTPRPARLAPVISNRYTPQLELPATHSKQTTVVLSNRYKKPPPGGVASWLPHRLTLRISNRNTPETGFAVTPTKQTTVVLSNRNKKPPPPGGVAFQLPRRNSGEYRRQFPPPFPIWPPSVEWPPRPWILHAPFEGNR